ncbi:MAG: stage III sporulation protein AC [Oscillospiraceae bacterium]|nr:stage III sporulation protein AC [Oscillospiraceae bacterium]
MDIAFVFKIAAVGIIVAVLNQILSKSGRDDYAMLTAIAGILVVLMMLLPKLQNLYRTVRSVFDL